MEFVNYRRFPITVVNMILAPQNRHILLAGQAGNACHVMQSQDMVSHVVVWSGNVVLPIP
eukprot:8281548-Karenia_brevis.AAC.1